VFWIVAVLIGAMALALRVYRLDALEPFVDEGANVLSSLDENVRREFDPIAQGRPLLAWMFRPAEFLPFATLTNARVLVALTGTFTVVLLGLGLGLSAGRRAALIGMALWAVLPIAVFHERLVLQDSAVAALLAAVFALMVLFARTLSSLRRSIVALGAGFLFGTALLVKVSALFALPWLGLAFVALQRQSARPVFERRCWLIAVGALIPFLFLGADIVRLGERLAQLGSVPDYSATSGLFTKTGAMMREVTDRVPLFFSWYMGYGGIALAVLLVAAAWALRRAGALALGLAIGWGMTALGAALIYRLPYARYIVPDHIPLVLFIAVALGAVSTRRLKIATTGLVAFALGAWLRTNVQVIQSPLNAPIPKGEVRQYVAGFWSGNGVQRVLDFLAAHTKVHGQPCLVITQAYYRPGCYGLMLAARQNPDLGVVPLIITPADAAAIDAVAARAAAIFGREPAVFVLDEDSSLPLARELRERGVETNPALDFVRADGISRFTLYRYPAAAMPPEKSR
jgi:hypothetical protein